jgi:tripartite-type tricarboxylate transporter receptor subunit TctC
MITRRSFLASTAGISLSSNFAFGQTWPARPITLVVPFAAGGTTDIIARMVGEVLGQRLGQSMVIENRSGAGGALGTDAVARAPADGYTLLHATAGTLTYNPHVVRKPGVEPQHPLSILTPIGQTFTTDFVVIVRKGFPATTLAEFIAHLRAKPGEVTFGSGGLGSGAHICTELFMERTGTRMRHIVYRGSGPALNDLAAGQIDVIFDAVPSALGQIEGSAVRALATTGPARSKILPDVGTVAELAIPDYAVTAWGGLLGPIGLHADIVAKVSAALAETLGRSEVQARFLKIGAEVLIESSEQMTRRIETEFPLWGGIIERANVAEKQAN